MIRETDNGFGEWGGYMDAKITKLEEQFAKSSDPFRQSNLFTGISIYVNGLTNPSADELKRIMMVHGGTFHHYQRSHTTYIIASNLPDVKVRNMNTSNIIRPEWVVDCLKERRILDYKNYLLYTNHKPSQPRLFFKKQEADSTVSGTNFDEDKECLNILKELEELNQKIKKTPSEDVLKIPSDDPEITNNADPIKTAPVGSKCAKSAVDPNFLSEFYNNSRLHHISTLGAGFKQYVSELREKHSGSFPDRDQLRLKLSENSEPPKTNSHTIMHIDMDCFFVSVGLRSRPHLRGQPIAVTHSKGAEAAVRPGVDRQREMELYMKRFDEKTNSNYMLSDKIKNGFEGTDSLSEIASCSYEARKMGVRNGMFVGQALKLCPNLKTIPYDFEEYKEVAFTLYNTVAQYTLNIEAVSCDEMFVDLSDVLSNLQAGAMDFVKSLRNEVTSKTGCPCSAGVGGNRLQARMATKKAKPDGQFLLNPENVEEYMANIPIKDLPGVGYSTSTTLENMELRTCGDLQKISLVKLQQEIGKKFGETLYQFCRGIDNRPLVYGQIRKSVSAEVNYGIRFTEHEELEKFLRQLCTEVHSRLMDIKRRGKCITLKLMVRSKDAPVESSKYMGHGVCDNVTKSTSLSDFTCDLNLITKTILAITKSLQLPPKELRGIGIQISKLDNPVDSKKKNENMLKIMFSKAADKQKEQQIATVSRGIEIADNLSPNKIAPEKRKLSPSSPEKKPSKMIKKGRGKVKQADPVDICNMLRNSAKTLNKEPLIDDIDYTVLAELPEDIREEILRERKKMKNPDLPEKTIRKEMKELVPPELCQQIENELKTHSKSNSTAEPSQTNNIFDQTNCRQLLELWLESSDTPENYDIDIISQNAQEFVQLKRISDLYVPLRLLYRIINEKESCSWHRAYANILNVVQNEMIAVYGCKILLKDHLDCNACNDN